MNIIDAQQRLRDLKPVSRIVDAIVSLSYQSLFLLWVGISFGIGILYYILSFIPGHGPEPLTHIDGVSRFWNSIYFSFITATSTGFGDITPMGFSKPISVIESILALMIFAILVTKLISHKQDIALRQIHKLVFEDVFHNIREGFFIVRKDFDAIIEKVEQAKRLDTNDWGNLETAYRQAQSFLRRIPDFYEPEDRLYTIDIRREELLLDGMHRTISRVHELLLTMRKIHINWIEQNKSVEELREYLQLTSVTLHFWEKHSPHNNHKAFEELIMLVKSIHVLIETAVMESKRPF